MKLKIPAESFTVLLFETFSSGSNLNVAYLVPIFNYFKENKTNKNKNTKKYMPLIRSGYAQQLIAIYTPSLGYSVDLIDQICQ